MKERFFLGNRLSERLVVVLDIRLLAKPFKPALLSLHGVFLGKAIFNFTANLLEGFCACLACILNVDKENGFPNLNGACCLTIF